MANSNYFWTEAQEEVLRESYAKEGGLQSAVLKLPEKTKGTIAVKASRMGLTTAKPRRAGRVSYSEDDSSESRSPNRMGN